SGDYRPRVEPVQPILLQCYLLGGLFLLGHGLSADRAPARMADIDQETLLIGSGPRATRAASTITPDGPRSCRAPSWHCRHAAPKIGRAVQYAEASYIRSEPARLWAGTQTGR